MGVRLYNPATGRFLSVDPIYGGNTNSYVYPENPLTKNDVTGRAWWPYDHKVNWSRRRAKHYARLFIRKGTFIEAGGAAADIGEKAGGEAFPVAGGILQVLSLLGDDIGEDFIAMGESVENHMGRTGVKGYIKVGFAHWYDPDVALDFHFRPKGGAV